LQGINRLTAIFRLFITIYDGNSPKIDTTKIKLILQFFTVNTITVVVVSYLVNKPLNTKKATNLNQKAGHAN